ncbi:nuclear pore complex protein Nup98-Nup96-like isoform X3 [Lytechinus variegatus]|uniref:nuclear pore complex protein Nup98-Nup96-like isoform X3 n=1 Tax=Lytechinus variegatus TaxID=7654 RepID=UPI001BB299F0|nr:nuclear pore complex protein Nup98-Nup96-like isoform X3 [Lytechinus variegatus]
MFGGSKTPFGGTSSFGTGNTSFGGATPATGGFGTPNAFGQSTPAGGGLFGSNPSTSTSGGLFSGGTSSFGQPSSTAFSFGSKSTSASGSLFGGTSTSTGGGLFPTPSASTSFGGSTAFGAGGGNKPLFGTSTSNTSLFGQSSTSSTPFGQTSTQQPSGGLFGGTTGSGLFGSSQQQNGTTIKFAPTTGSDTMVKNGASTNVNTKHQVITAMKEYTNKSFEELRVEDYLANRKGGSSGGGLLGATGMTSTDNKPSLFGQPASTASSAFNFGQSKSTFGGTPSSFGTGTSLFGGNNNQQQQQQQQQSGGLFGSKPLFGQTSTSTAGSGLFGQSSGTSLFGQNPTQQKSLFGGTSQTPGTGLFGSTPGSTGSTGFGTGGFGTGTFGQQTQQGGLFGKTAPNFGTPASQTGLSLGTSTGTGGLFGATSKPGLTLGTGTGTGFGFGSGAGTGSSLFGGSKGTTGFGTGGLSGGTFGTGNLGSTFGGGTSGSLFGGNKPAGLGTTFGTTGTFGSGLGGTTGLTGGGIGAAQGVGGQQANVDMNTQVQQQLMTLFNSPYGDNPLFKNILVDSDKKKDALPGSSSQKSLSSPSHYKVSARPGAKLRPKLLQRGGGKSKLFDGLEEEDNTLNSETFVTRRSIKKLVIKNKGSQDDSRNESYHGSRSSVKPDELASPLPVYPRDQSNASVRLTPDKDDEEPNTSDIPLFNKPKVLEDTTAMESPGNKHEDPDCTIHAMNAQPKRQQRKPSGSGAAPPPPVSSLSPGGSPPASTKEPLNVSRGSQGDVSLEVSGEDEILDQENQPPPHPAKVVLRRTGYYTIPTLRELADLTDDDGNCFVDDFTVGRERYGSVFFPGMTNVKGLNLDDIVHFRRKEITIYPDDTCKPNVGTGLNKKAEVTLDQTWPIDKSTRQPIKDPERLVSLEYEERLERATAKLGAKFIEYRPETGSWVFQVQHFSKYGLTDSDEEDGGQAQQQQGQKGVKKVDKAPAKEPTKPPPAKQKDEKQKSSSTRAPLQENGSIQYLPEEPMREELELAMDTVSDRSVPRSRGLGGQMIQDQYMAGEAGDFDTYMPCDDTDQHPGPDEVMEGGQRSLDVSHRLAEAIGVSSHRMQVMKASFFAEEEEEPFAHSGSFAKAPGRDGERRIPRPSREPLFEREQAGDMWQASMMGSPAKFLAGMSSPLLQGRVASPIPRFLRESMDTRDQVPIMPAGMSPQEKIPKIVGARPHLSMAPLEDSVVFERHDHLADSGLMMGRSFRVGWGPNWTLVHSGKAVGVQGFRPKIKEEPMPFTLLTSKSMVKPATESSPFKVTLEKVNIAPMFGKPGHTSRMYERSLEVELDHSMCSTAQPCPAFAPQSGIDALHRYAKESVTDKKEGTGYDPELLEHTRLVWALMVALWGQLPEEEGKGPLDPTSYPYRKARRKAMSQWLSDSCRKHIDDEVQDSKFRHLGHVEAIFALLTGRQINEACLKAQESGDHRLALLLAQAGATHEARHLVGTQLIHWEQLRADQFIADEYLKVYSLLAGQLVWQSSRGAVNVCEDLDWKRALAVHLWYHNYQEASIADGLQAFEDGFTGKSALGDYCLPPRPPYMESNPGFYKEDLSALESMDDGDGLMPSRDRFPVWDMCYHLLKLYCDKTHRMHNVLAPTAHSPYQLDYRLSWHVLQVLHALGYTHLSPHRQAHLTVSYASQLESIGLWHWAAFVLLHIPNDIAREDLVRSLLERHITLELTGNQLTVQESFLVERLHVPVEWIHDAKALRALYEGREREEAWHLLKAGRWNDCHMVLIKKIAANAIINESYGFLKGVLDELSYVERSSLIQDWSTNGQVYLDFININERLVELGRREPTTFEVEKLHPDIASLCLRVGGVYCQTVKDRVCRSEMAKRTANMMKAVLTLQQESLANAAGSSPTRQPNPLIPSRLLAPHVTKLPLPEDYSLQELRQLTRSYTQELTA